MAESGMVGQTERRWNLFIDIVTFVWLGVFLAVILHADYPVLSLLDAATVKLLDDVLFLMTVLFLADLWLQYRWSDLTIGPFLRLRWFDVLMAIPFLRPLRGLRILRVGRLATIFRVAVKGKKAVALVKKSKRAAAAARAAKATVASDGAPSSE